MALNTRWLSGTVCARVHTVVCAGTSATAELKPLRLLWVLSKILAAVAANSKECVSHIKLHPCKLVEDAGALFMLARVSP